MPREFKDVPGFEEFYYVCSWGVVFSKRRDRALLPYLANGYGMVELCGANKKRWKVHVHRLVALAFLGEPKGLEVDHIDGNKARNVLSNLRYVTHKENIANRDALGKTAKGSRSARAKLNEEQVAAIRASDMTLTELGREYGVTKQTIAAILNRLTWKHVA